MYDDRDQFPWAEFDQDTRDSIRGANNYNPARPEQGGEWPHQPINDITSDTLMWQDAYDPS